MDGAMIVSAVEIQCVHTTRIIDFFARRSDVIKQGVHVRHDQVVSRSQLQRQSVPFFY